MAGFKKYLSEIPHYLSNYGARCPMGDMIDPSKNTTHIGNNGKPESYSFDYGAEFITDPEIKNYLLQTFGMLNPRPKGIHPMYCKQHDILFMYDFDNDTPVKANSEQRHVLQQILIGKRGVRKRDNLRDPQMANTKIY
jgi:hypothetical protein